MVDSTAPNLEEHRSTVLGVLQQIGVSEEKLENMIEVWNKVQQNNSCPSIKIHEKTLIDCTCIHLIAENVSD